MAIIRTATENDLNRILDIYTPFVTDTTISFEYEVPDAASFLHRYKEITVQFPWLVWETNGVVAGYAYASPTFSRAAYQWDCDLAVYVDPAYHRQGIASDLYGCLEKILALQGYYNIYAVITGGNQTSLEFHRALGYDLMATMPHSGYKFGAWLDVVWYHKALRKFGEEPIPPRTFNALPPGQVQDILQLYT